MPSDASAVVTLSDSCRSPSQVGGLGSMPLGRNGKSDPARLRASESAARAGERASAKSALVPALFRGLVGHTQQSTIPISGGSRAQRCGRPNYQACRGPEPGSTPRLASPSSMRDLPVHHDQEQTELWDRNSGFPFSFTNQPFQARLRCRSDLRPVQPAGPVYQPRPDRGPSERVRARELAGPVPT